MASIAVAQTGHTSSYVIWEMPLTEVFIWEHIHHELNGAKCYRVGERVSDSLASAWRVLNKS